MKDKVLYAALGALIVVCLGQAYFLHAQNTSTPTVTGDKWEERAERMQQDALQRIQKGEALPPSLFDGFFNDEFFGRRFNPFTEMERMHRQMAALFQESERSAFNNSWDKWFSDRLGMEDFKTDITRTEKEVILAIVIPGIDNKTADININADRIRISFTARNIQDKNEAGRSMHSESSQSYVKVLPVPEDAVAASARTEIEKNRVVVAFDRKKK
ncbi:MAG TPA: hypothetical protein PKI19_08695 [Elusimicrobiales bacterium]|nr:hypothetical protein [Elusimicrobiales bacterium]